MHRRDVFPPILFLCPTYSTITARVPFGVSKAKLILDTSATLGLGGFQSYIISDLN